MKKMTFAEHKKICIEDVEAVIKILNEQIASIKEGHLREFESFWINSEDDADSRILKIRDIVVIRYLSRDDELQRQ